MKNIHVFDNGLKVYGAHLLQLQRERYLHHNIHEAEEEGIFLELIDELETGSTFVNVGAAIGYYVILAKLQRPDLRVIPIRFPARRR